MGFKSFFAGLFRSQSAHDINDPTQGAAAGWNTTGSLFPPISQAGTKVTPGTSMKLSAYYACIRNISEDVAKLPGGAFRLLPEGGKELVPRSPANLLFTVSPNEEMTPFSFKSVMVSHVLGWGNAYAEIQRNGRGDVVGLHPIHPSRVIVDRAKDGSVYYRVFKVPFETAPHLKGFGEYVDISPEDMFHVLGLGGDGLVGYSVAKYAQESLGTALATQIYGASFFGNGTTLGGLLEHPAQLSKEAQERLLDSWTKKHSGPQNAHKTAILEEGMKWVSTSVPPRDAQFLEVRQFQVVDIARWFRMPPHKIQSMEGAKFNNIEHLGMEYVDDCLLPILIKFEEEIKRKIITQRAEIFKFNASLLRRGDAKARSEYYRTMINLGAMTPNQARELEDMNPGPSELDRYYMQTSMGTLDQIVAGELQPIETMEDAAEETTVEIVEDDEAADAMAEALRPVLNSAIDRIETREAKALERQQKKGHSVDWAEAFFRDQSQMAFSNLSAVVTTYGNANRWSSAAHAEAIRILDHWIGETYISRSVNYENQAETIGERAELLEAVAYAYEGGNNVAEML